MANKKILLIEPGYRNKYPPLGLMKIAQYHGPEGKRDDVVFIKGEDSKVIGKHWDRIYITTLFSFEWKRTERSIDFAIDVANGDKSKIFVGGIAASLMNEEFMHVEKWRGIRFIKGLLGGAPAKSLQLDEFEEELYSDDYSNKAIEDYVPDYSILNQIEYRYPVNDAYFTYTSRGCVRKCQFCGVPALEGGQRDTNSLSYIVQEIDKLYGPKKDLILMDNNVVASANFKDIIDEIVDLGFHAGATIRRGNSVAQRRVDFNQGVDARILCKDQMYLKQLSRIAIKPLRIAFDHLGVKKPYETAIRMSADVGLENLSNYMLYNFHDTPEDLFIRMRLNVELNEELGIRIFSFPMRYQPVNLPDRSHIGKNWNAYYLRSMQIVLQATHGIVSGSPTFFKRAFGDSFSDFESILSMPHHFIFNREWYESHGGKAEYEEFQNQYRRLNTEQLANLIEVLSRTSKLKDLPNFFSLAGSVDVRNMLQFYVPPSKDQESAIWAEMQKIRNSTYENIDLPEDEKVEDSALTDLDFNALDSSQNVAKLSQVL